MQQSIHQQLIRGIKGLNAAQARQLQTLLARLKEGGDLAIDATGEPSPIEVDGDLPQPVCAQDEQAGPGATAWGPPPLAGINFEQMQLIACLIREANEARNARRQRFGM